MKKENLKLLESTILKFEEKNDTLLALPSINGDNNVMFTGTPSDLTITFYSILKHGLADDASNLQKALAVIMMEGIGMLIMEDSDERDKFDRMIANLFEEADAERGEREFEPTDEECLNCKHYVRCLKNNLSEVGVEIEVKKMPKSKKNRKNGK